MLGSITAALMVAICIFLSILNWEKNFTRYVEKRDWTATGKLWEKRIKGNEKREEQANETLYEAVDTLMEAYIAESMTYQDAEKNLKAMGDFWDDDYVQATLEEIQILQMRREAERILIGHWELTEIQVGGLSFPTEEYLSIYGVNIGELELTFKADGTLSIDTFLGVAGEGTWRLEADGTYYIDAENERTEGSWNYDGTALILMDVEGNVMGECRGDTLFLGEEHVGALFERRGS